MLERVRQKLRDTALGLDVVMSRLAHAGPRLALWPVMYAVFLGSGVFTIRHLSWVQNLDNNKLPTKDTYQMAVWTGGAFVLLALTYGAAVLVERLRTGRANVHAVFARMNGRLAPVVAIPPAVMLTLTNIERDSPKQTFFLVLCAAVPIAVGAYAWAKPSRLLSADDMPSPNDAPSPARRWQTLLSGAGAWALVLLLAAGYGAFFSYLSITNHHALNTRTTDLGYYDNIFYQSIHGKPLGCSFIKAGYHGSAHFDPLLVVLSPIYLLYPHAELILGLQAVWLGLGAIPSFLIGRHFAGKLAGVALAAMYVVHPALHGSNMYEFHSLTLLTPLLLLLLYLLITGRRRAYYVMLVPTLLCREDVALLLCFVGAFGVLTRKPPQQRMGWVTVFSSLIYFAIVKRFFMTSADIFMSGKDSYSFAYYYEDLIPNKNGAGGMLISLLTNPAFVLKTMLSELKVLYLLTVFLPLMFLPFLAKTGRVMLIYGLLFCLLASRGAVYSPHFQYSATLLPVAFALAPMALKRIEDDGLLGFDLDKRRLSRGLLAGAFAASLLVSWKHGAVLENQSFKGGFFRVARGLTDRDKTVYAWVKKQADSIPVKASVAVTNRLGAHVSNRKDAFFYPEKTNVDYIFIDEAELRPPELEKHQKHLQKGTVVQVARFEKLVLFKRVK